jgi:hypothetical protein
MRREIPSGLAAEYAGHLASEREIADWFDEGEESLRKQGVDRVRVAGAFASCT